MGVLESERTGGLDMCQLRCVPVLGHEVFLLSVWSSQYFEGGEGGQGCQGHGGQGKGQG